MRHATGLMVLARSPTACMNHQFTVASQAWSGDPQQPEHRWLAQIKYDAFVTSAHYRELDRDILQQVNEIAIDGSSSDTNDQPNDFGGIQTRWNTNSRGWTPFQTGSHDQFSICCRCCWSSPSIQAFRLANCSPRALWPVMHNEDTCGLPL